MRIEVELGWLAAIFPVVAAASMLAEHRGLRAYFARVRLVDWAWWPFTTLVVGGITRVATIGVVSAAVLVVAHVPPGGALAWLAGDGVHGVGRWPFAAQLAFALVVGDLVNYWNHRLRHTRWLWPFHAVHHSPRNLDWLASVRIHPVDDLVDNVMVGGVVLACGVAPLVWLVTGPILLFFDAWLHLAVDWDLGPLRYVLATPKFHRLHHAVDVPSCNFAGVLPVYDLVFGTYRMPDAPPRAFGAGTTDVPETLLRQLVFPFAELVRQARARSAP